MERKTTATETNIGSYANNQSCFASFATSRNKHSRFIWAYYGGWQRLSIHSLEQAAHSNFLTPRPRETDPGVMYDVLKVRRLVDEATDLAVRAHHGAVSSMLAISFGSNSKNTAKLSPERKYRMREHAAQKLAEAYRIDEIAASVAAMQGSSALDAVASFVLQRCPQNVDAKYTHFFHDRIPSQTAMAESSALNCLDELVAHNPGSAASFRTRALAKIAQGDPEGAIHDLTEALALCRLDAARTTGICRLISMRNVQDKEDTKKLWARDWMNGVKVAEEDRPCGLEMQLLFQRASQYFDMSCRYIEPALEGLRVAAEITAQSSNKTAAVTPPAEEYNETKGIESSVSLEQMEKQYKIGYEAREIMRKYAKKAIRDYTSFFSQLDYSYWTGGSSTSLKRISKRDVLEDASSVPTMGVAFDISKEADATNEQVRLAVHSLSSLFSTASMQNLPQFPTTTPSMGKSNDEDGARREDPPSPGQHEMVTYHPLLVEALHAFLLAHCLLQTPATTLQRHAYNVARITRLTHGDPLFFHAARSSARADWCRVLRKADNWIKLRSDWNSLTELVKRSDSSSKSGSTTSTSPPSGLTAPSIRARGTTRGHDSERTMVAAATVAAATDAGQKGMRETEVVARAGNGEDEGKEGKNINEQEVTKPAQKLREKLLVDQESIFCTGRADAIVAWVTGAPSLTDLPCNLCSSSTKNAKQKKKNKKTTKKKPTNVNDSDGGAGDDGIQLTS